MRNLALRKTSCSGRFRFPIPRLPNNSESAIACLLCIGRAVLQPHPLVLRESELRKSTRRNPCSASILAFRCVPERAHFYISGIPIAILLFIGNFSTRVQQVLNYNNSSCNSQFKNPSSKCITDPGTREDLAGSAEAILLIIFTATCRIMGTYFSEFISGARR